MSEGDKTGSGALPKSEGGPLELSGEVEARRVFAKYAHPLRHYVALFEKAGMEPSKHGERKLKHWIAAGRKQVPEDLPPFDRLEDMEAWWERCMTWRAPEWLKGFAGEKTEEKKEEEQPPEPEQKLPTLSGIKIDLDDSSDDGVRIFQAVVADTLRRLNEAAHLGARTEYNRLLRELNEQLESLRKQKAAALKMAEAKGDALRTRVLTSETVGTFTVLAYSFTNALMDLAEKLAPTVPVAERRAMVMPLRDRVFLHVRKTRFREAWDQTRERVAKEPAWNSSALVS